MEASDTGVVCLNRVALIPQCGASLGFLVLLGPLGMSRASEQHFLVHFGESDGLFVLLLRETQPRLSRIQNSLAFAVKTLVFAVRMLSSHLLFGVPVWFCLPSL